MRRLAATLLGGGLLVILGVGGAAAECKLGRKCTDHEAVELVRTEIAARCDCTGAERHKDYVKCAKGIIKDAVKGGVLPKKCKRGVKKCEAKSICGIPGAVACCQSKRNGRLKAKVVKDSAKCKGEVCIGHNAAADACDPDASCAPLVRPFRNVQQVFTESCSLGGCHSAASAQGNLVLNEEELSYASLVDVDASHEDAPAGLKRVVPGDSANSLLIQKLRGTGVGDAMPQALPSLPDAIIEMIELWIDRGAPTTVEECEALVVDEVSTPSGPITVVSGEHNTSGSTVCDDRPIITGNYEWEPEPPLPPPAPNEGVQLYAPKKDVAPGTEWETCVAVTLDLAKIRQDMGFQPNEPVVIKDQVYRMHEGSHHMLIYGYLGQHAEDYPEGHFPCVAGNCRDNNCPEDSGNILPIGGTQVAGTRYEVTYPPGVGIPLLGSTIILNLHYTNPFQPAQDIYGESWVNLDFYKSGEFKVLLDGIFAVNSSFVVEPFESVTSSRIWQPAGILPPRQPVDAAIFQLFGHMHLRGRHFIIDRVSGGNCTGEGQECCVGRECDPIVRCAYRDGRRGACIDGTCQRVCARDSDCPSGETCVVGPDPVDVKIYDTRSWDNAPVTDFPPPYVRVNKDEGLRWTCVHTNGIIEDGEEVLPPKRCHEDCNACGWNDADRKCHFEDGRIFDEGEPMPLIFGLLADDDMCNMFGYFVNAASLPLIGQ